MKYTIYAESVIGKEYQIKAIEQVLPGDTIK